MSDVGAPRSEDGAAAIAAAVLTRYLHDRDAGRSPTLEDYERMYPGHESAVRDAWRGIVGEDEPDDPVTQPEVDALLDPLKRIGPYTIERELGRGGQGQVYLAHDPRLNRHVALKLLSTAFAFTEEAKRRFHREAEAASRLQHPGIAAIYEAGEDRGIPYIAMQYVDGEMLSHRISSTRARSATPTSVGEEPSDDTPAAAADGTSDSGRDAVVSALECVERIARALHVAHEAGLVHRDIKPGNIVITPEGDPVLLDFGLARDTGDDHATLTATGAVVGTPAYLAPEQIQPDGRGIDRRSDVYALGVTLFECLTARRPFEAPTRDALYRLILSAPAPPARRWNRSVSRDLDVVLSTAMEKDRERRYRTAEDLAEDLRRVRRREPIRARPAGAGLRLLRWTQRNPVLATLTVSVFAALSIALAVTFVKNRALDQALADAREEKARAEEALRKVDRLADARHLRGLRATAAELWPVRPALIEDYVRWLEDARAVLGRFDQHAAALEALRASARPYDITARRRDHPELFKQIDRRRARRLALQRRASEDEPPAEEIAHLEGEIASLLERTEQRHSWSFERPEDRRLHDILMSVLDEYRGFRGGAGGVFESVVERLALARELEQKTLVDHGEAWEIARAAVLADDRYGLTGFEPIVGLIPLGADPDSGLQEFAWYQPGEELPVRDPASGALRVTSSTHQVFVFLPGGLSRIGVEPNSALAGPAPVHPSEAPSHTVILRPFFIAKYELARHHYERFTARFRIDVGKGIEWESPKHPVSGLSWNEASWLLSCFGMFLPTEAQWEYAARGGTAWHWWPGRDPEAMFHKVNLADESSVRLGTPGPFVRGHDDGHPSAAPVDAFGANPFGLYNILGNVSEWCLDRYVSYEVDARAGDGLREGRAFEAELESHRVARGGSFADGIPGVRASRREPLEPDVRHARLGVRPLIPLP